MFGCILTMMIGGKFRSEKMLRINIAHFNELIHEPDCFRVYSSSRI
jgi:hypothetical protein